MEVVRTYVEELVLFPPLEQLTNSTLLREWGRNISRTFWTPEFWLPPGMDWEEFNSRPDITHGDPTEIWTHPILLAVIFFALRMCVINPYLATPVANYFGLRQKLKPVPRPNTKLEQIFKTYKGCIPDKIISNACIETNMTTRQIESWIRQRSALDKMTKLEKFQDTMFVFVYHVVISVICVTTLYSQPWLWDISTAWDGYPHHNIDRGMWWMYMISLGFYWTQIAWQLLYGHGKDRVATFAHHLCTIFLMAFSWTSHFIRMGSIVLLLHEVTDIPVLIAKMFLYVKKKKYTDICFAMFVILWTITRTILYPFWFLKECLFDMPDHLKSNSVYIQFTFGVLLSVLNFFWTIMIYKMLYRNIIVGKDIVDTRSSDDQSEAEVQTNHKKNI